MILDSCFSGAFIGRSADTGDVSRGAAAQVCSVFSGDSLSAGGGHTYFVLTASSRYELSLCNSMGIFTSKLARGMGYPSASGYPADTNNDGMLTLKELYNYCLQAVWTESDTTQTVCASPSGSNEVLFIP